MTPSPALPARRGGSTFRLLAGTVLLIVAFAMAVFGFLSLVRVLDGGGYGTPPMRRALAILGAAGACFAGGVATLIWDVAKRYENP